MHVCAFFVCPEGDVLPPAAHRPLRILHHDAHPVRLRGPVAAGVHVEGVIEMDADPAPGHTPATAHTLGHGNAEDKEAAPGDATREHALAP